MGYDAQMPHDRSNNRLFIASLAGEFEVWGVLSDRGTMPLHLADVRLHRARLSRDTSQLAKARTLIEKHGYWRRKEELEDAEAALLG
jgi:hypothetical protein